jgi:hypothetical protein
VHGLLGDQQEDGGADVAARGAAATSAAVPRRPVERSRVAAAWMVVTTAGGAAVPVVHGVHLCLLDMSDNSNDTSLLSSIEDRWNSGCVAGGPLVGGSRTHGSPGASGSSRGEP